MDVAAEMNGFKVDVVGPKVVGSKGPADVFQCKEVRRRFGKGSMNGR